MSKFKVGDRVRIKYIRTAEAQRFNGRVMSIIECCRDGYYDGQRMGVYTFINSGGGVWEDELTLETNNNMNIKEKFTLAFKSEPEKSFRKAGITNGDDFLTDDGRLVFESWLLKKFGADFKTEVVDGLLDEKDAE